MSSNNWFVIVNPTASGGKARRAWPGISQELKAAGIRYEMAFSQYSGHSMDLAERAIEQGYRKIAAVGGDGTCNEVANGILRQKTCPSAEVKFGLIAVGTGNDWIRTHGIPKQVKAAVKLLVQEKTTLQDAGLMSCYNNGEKVERYFINVAGFSFDGFVGKIAAGNRKIVSNKFFYLGLVMSSLWQFEVPRVKVTADGEVSEGKFYTINAGICRYSGGGMQIVPHAVPDDGLFALTIAKDISKADVIINTPRFYTGSLATHPKIHTSQARDILIEGTDGRTVLAEVDGEYIGECPAQLKMIDKAFQIVIP